MLRFQPRTGGLEAQTQPPCLATTFSESIDSLDEFLPKVKKTLKHFFAAHTFYSGFDFDFEGENVTFG